MLDRIYDRSSKVIKGKRMDDLIRVYEDLEKTLKTIRDTAGEGGAAAYPINVRKLIQQLARSKKRLERKIGNKILLERQNLKRRIKRFADAI